MTDIYVIGSGLSSLVIVKSLIRDGLEKYITVITSSDNYGLDRYLTPKEEYFFSKNHKKIADSGGKYYVDVHTLKKASKAKTNILNMHSLGGLGNYWGGGIDIDEIQNQGKINEILDISSIDIKPSKDRVMKALLPNINPKRFGIVSTTEKEYMDPRNIEIINPGIELERLSKMHHFKIIYKTVSKLKCKNKSHKKDNKLEIVLDDGKSLTASWAILCAGAISTGNILKTSHLIDANSLVIQDHAMYRYALLNLPSLAKKLLSLLRINSSFLSDFSNSAPVSLDGKNHNKNSLIEAYSIGSMKEKSSFLGIYSLLGKDLKFNKLIKWLIINDVLLIAQVYQGGEQGKIFADFNSYSEKAPGLSIRIKKGLTGLYLLKSTFLLSLKNQYLAIPIGWRLPFGSSYHLHGIISHNAYKLFNKKMNNNIENIIIGDMTFCQNICAAPPSHIQVLNALRISDFIKKQYFIKEF